MDKAQRSYVPAAGHDWLLPFYDPLLWISRAETVKRPLIEQAGIRAGNRVLDLGCGTGSLTVLTKRLHPEASVTGLDPDPKALVRAKRKARRSGVEVDLEEGFADEIPHPPASFDRVLSSFVFHHLDHDTQVAALRDVRRVLAPGGSFHLLDFAPPHDRKEGLLARLFHGTPHGGDHVEGRLAEMMGEAGFDQPEEVAHRSTLFGSVSYYRGVQPPG